jgi:hypothetical protein
MEDGGKSRGIKPEKEKGSRNVSSEREGVVDEHLLAQYSGG